MTAKSKGSSLAPEPSEKEHIRDEKKARIVAIGASAGGLQAIYSFFDHCGETPKHVSFVIIQHLSPDYKSLMPELLSRHTELPIKTIEDGMPIEGGSVYVGKPNKVVHIEDSVFITEDRDPQLLVHFPINAFFSSLAEAQKDKAIAIILSGSGSDGTHGIEAIKDRGGTIIVQEESTAAFNGMPKNAVQTGLVDHIAPPEEIASIVIDLLNNVNINARDKDVNLDAASVEAVAAMLLRTVNNHLDIDFTNYKSNTILRRIERRMVKNGTKKISEYYSYVSANKEEAKILANEFLINVTGFFRDAKAFDYIGSIIVPQLFKESERKEQVRVWSVGCSSGQEPYSLAILIAEYMREQNIRKQVKIFATDAHEESLSIASKGIYAEDEVENIPKELLDRYFTELEAGLYQVKPSIRDMIVFAVHNVVKDPPFNNINLVTCRNLLIYLKAELQQKILSYIHFALVKKGKLFLGSSESPFLKDENYRVLSTEHRVFERANGAGYNNGPRLYTSKTREKITVPAKNYRSQKSEKTESAKLLDQIKETVLYDLTPACVVVNYADEVVHVFGNVERFLSFPKKQFQFKLLNMVPKSMGIPLNTLLTTIRKDKKKVTFNKIRAELENTTVYTRISGMPIGTATSDVGLIAVSFEETQELEKPDSDQGNNQGLDVLRVSQLEEELQETKEFLQNTVEELETSNEELQATNEELIASNEELQSTNEELQSVNEELYSVNTEFQSKVSEMMESNDDLSNLLQSTEIGTIFLDDKLRIRKFTPAIKEHINLGDADVGRHISDLNNKLINVDLEAESTEVMTSLKTLEYEVQNVSQDYYLMRLIPYKNSDNKIDGVVITFVHINRLKQAQNSLQEKTVNLARTNSELEQVAYVATHDLRGPVINLRGLLDIHMKRQKLTEEDDVIKRLNANIDRIVTTLDGLIEVISYQKSTEKELINIDLQELLGLVLSGLDSMLNEKGGEIKLELEAKQMKSVTGYLKSILQNLLTNAIKYADPNRKPEILVKSENKPNGKIRITVEDNGIGIDDQHQDFVFQAFKRLSVYGDGKGIGLYLVKSQVEALGGTVSMTSIVGKGTKFVLDF